ncbi:hypothetical protein RHMOL_Rhmol05G0023200 [Rhododendron molle]|uniref:Uncharacterized protein n=1 Tax=Rhododendron molle TaxID=49168 RepID=A0ACC0NJU3_RHOML|nr:hypothetical protein RHMOL_Rhmol05G0023200 [Rhododendron molle]
MVLCSGVCNTVLRTFEPLDCASDGLDLILTMIGSQLLIVQMRSKPSDTRFDGSDEGFTLFSSIFFVHIN